MVWNEATRPANHCIATTSKYINIFYDTEQPTFALAPVSGGSFAATTYLVRNYYGTTVASGTLSGTSLTLPILPLGWYKLYLVRPSAAASPWLTAGGEALFVVCRSTSPLISRPDWGTPPAAADPVGEGMDYPMRGFTGLGPHRHSVYLDDPRYATSLAAMESNSTYASTYWATDAARPLRQCTTFPETTGGTSPTGTQHDRIQATVSSGIDHGSPWFEGRNEPQVTTVYADYYPELQAYANTVHAVSASALVMGPCPIYVHGGPGSYNGLAWVDGLLGLGGGSYIDVFSFHNYNSGDLPSMRKSMDDLETVLTKYGQQDKPRYVTEFGSRFAAVYGSWEHRLQTQKVMFELHMLEQYKVPKEHTSYFYDIAHGFWDFPSWVVCAEFAESNPNPMVATVRVWSEELFGKAFAARLDFGTIENDHWLGSRFDHPSNGTSVVALQSDGRAGQVTLAVTGATSLNWVDPWGNVATKTVTGGLAVFDVDSLPIYVRLPAGVTAVPEIVKYGIEVVRAQFATASANTNTSDAAQGIDGVIGTTDTVFETDAIYQGVEGTAPPSWFQIDFPATTRFDRVVVHCPDPWQHDCSLLAFELQTWNGSTWDTRVSVSEPAATYQWTSSKASGACFTDSYYSRKHLWVLQLVSAVATTKVRVYATDYTYGSGATVDTTNGAGLAGGATGQGSPRHISIREVQVFLAEGADGLTHRGQPMLIQPRP
jgi:hypothetical protein